ncbi:hypothetical protein KKC13_09955 [bacterium]|nr:hypothetical protein [bacterium]MBU1956946.1 hypothetical protein [bacterium]
MKKVIFSLIIGSILSMAESTGWRKISNFGCHLVDKTCYVNIEGSAVGPESCHGSVR